MRAALRHTLTKRTAESGVPTCTEEAGRDMSDHHHELCDKEHRGSKWYVQNASVRHGFPAFLGCAEALPLVVPYLGHRAFLNSVSKGSGIC